MTTRAMRRLFYVIEINLLMWVGVAWGVWRSSAEDHIKWMAVGGAVVAAVLQHWAYYDLFKKAKEQRQPPNPQGEGIRR
jgi:hypothetical protein